MDDSYRTIDTPPFLSALLARQERNRPKSCACHGRTDVFSGHGAANGAARRTGVKLVDVAQRAGVSAGTVSDVPNRPETVIWEEALAARRRCVPAHPWLCSTPC
ncbi:hypothetical protein AB0A71_06925 [Kitasatospora aureofaciens]|uniref:hypothetical protein n=1 Tax=Kitasatospora aureofaciens TaxID=1894 RepID=UPI0033D302FD